MAKKNHWYVLVMTNSGPVFVTEIDNATKYATWNAKEAPLEMSSSKAEDLAIGLTWNIISAFVVKSPFEIDRQPYMYSLGEFEWKWDKDKKEE